MLKKRMLEVVCVKTFHIRTSTNDTKLAMLAVTIAANGTVLPLMGASKGQRRGRITTTEFSTYPTTDEGGKGDGVGGKVSGGAKQSEGVAEPHVHSAECKKARLLDSVWDVVENHRFALDPDLIRSEVEVVGTTESQRGRLCTKHSCCGEALVRVDSHVCFR